MVYLPVKPLLDWRAIALYGLTLRAITDADQPFLAQLYASTREDELAVLDWSPEQKTSFLEMQFHAQHTFYMGQFQQATFDIIELTQDSLNAASLNKDEKPNRKDTKLDRKNEKIPIGRLYLEQRSDEIRIIDIALLPPHRNQGIGTRLLNMILAKGQQLNVPVRIHVEQFNPALRLYLRLGFQAIEEQGIYYLMEWLPQVQL
ncbi:MAG: GNAT family N-acetyltransferase [Symploca sp. SIO2B6]|nr:GNAT family N-acetyltransferase [Symploca sp. SIO2B6]